MRIGYLCDRSPEDRGSYSGGNARIFSTLAEYVGDVTPLPLHWFGAEPAARLLDSMSEAVNMRARWRAQLALSGIIGRGLSRHVAAEGYDVVFGAYSSHSLAGLRVPPGTVLAYTSDATPTTYRESSVGASYGSWFSLSRRLDPWILRHETRAFHAADLLLWPSDWLNRAAVARYGLDPARSITVPWGANLPWVPPKPLPRPLGRGRPLRLLLVGRDWWSKGGPLAVETLRRLRAGGIDARLTVIGTVPPKEVLSPEVTVHRYLDKSDPAGMKTFETAMIDAHFLLQPSHESYGFAFCEASAYGLPALCLAVGGVPVREGINGHALPEGAGPEDFARIIEGYIDRPESYETLALSSREEYETRLNWEAWGRTVRQHLETALARKRADQ